MDIWDILLLDTNRPEAQLAMKQAQWAFALTATGLYLFGVGEVLLSAAWIPAIVMILILLYVWGVFMEDNNEV